MTASLLPCDSCSSTGSTFRDKDRCRKCKGRRVLEEKKVVEVYIPRGSSQGDHIVLEGEADEQPGFETGNIVFVIQEKQHDVFERLGADLKATVKVSLAEALTGLKRTVVKHLDGRAIAVEVPRGKVLRPGQVLRVKGEGMPMKKSELRGDLYLEIEIEFPEDGWMADVDAIRNILPAGNVPKVEGEPVDEVVFEEAGIEEVG